MNEIKLIMKFTDMGWPDEGHYEYCLARTGKRKSKFFQFLFGDYENILLWYGEEKPSDTMVEEDIKRFKIYI